MCFEHWSFLLVPRPQAVGTGHKMRWVFFCITFPPLQNEQIAQYYPWGLSSFDPLFPGQPKRSFEETKRLGFSKNAYRNVRKAYFDKRTTQSEFCFETNILCNRRSVQWKIMKYISKEAQVKLVNKQPSDFWFTKFYAVLELVEANSGLFQNVYGL